LADSDWIEWNGDGLKYCLINTVCSVLIVLRDRFKNIVTTPKVFTKRDVDITLLGPYNPWNPTENLYISTIDSTESE